MEKIDLLFEELGCDVNYLKTHPEYNLLDEMIGLEARDLLFIYFFIKQEFHLEIPLQIILNDEFNSYHTIQKLVKGCVDNV